MIGKLLFRWRQEQEGFPALQSIQASSVADISGYQGLCLSIKRGSEVDHFPPSSSKIKNMRNCTASPPHAFMAWGLMKYKDFSTNPDTWTFIIINPYRCPYAWAFGDDLVNS